MQRNCKSINTIPTVKQFKYFGSIIQENDSSDLETEKGFMKQE
jgi:hypothetical protein